MWCDAVRPLLILVLFGCSDPVERVRGTWVVDIEALARHDHLAPLPAGPARTMAVDFARDHYADSAFRFDPPVCVETQRSGVVERPCEVVRIDRRRVVVFDMRHEDRMERLRLYISRKGDIELERGSHRLPLKRAGAAR